MSRIAEAFATARSRGELALVPYLTSGYPNTTETVDLVRAAVDGGADVIEFGVPFSDPMGDGRVIQEASQVALAGGMTLTGTLEQVSATRAAGVTTPIALMGYLNPFLRYGVKQLFADAAEAGVDGFIVPDLPPDAAGFTEKWIEQATASGVDLVFFAAPGSSPQRLAAAGAATGGFLYCLATDGVTGAREDLDERLPAYLARVRAATDAALAVGFGISHPRHVAALRGLTDGVIVGSALLREIAATGNAEGRRAAVTRLVGELKAAGL
ncbi:tryptophan synthase subunit alpha [Saccharopolyspora phatthalungensis]|uniref:Tryptophan synthase alpha chain n=1 Tax=Saccharopolyspora phatthalungensis TaxID=664693 RepID=A0A840Q3Z7_9PSEU|nr:tryptophan synthase subunit alpha [Saccharopolyspora phatthalungensis]MBB5157222.1 tryptophan synthase alpha subunit [Saccharopolyspora phatthalungensis]